MEVLCGGAGEAKGVMSCKHILAAVCAVAVCCGSGGALGQAIYKQIDAAGRSSFTDRPPADGSFMRDETVLSQERASMPPPRIATGNRSDVAQALFSNSEMSSLYAATIDFNEATRRLRQARQSRRDAMQPRPGEWTDPAKTTTTSKSHEKRQQRLNREIVAAERRLHQTLSVRSARLRRDANIERLTLVLP